MFFCVRKRERIWREQQKLYVNTFCCYRDSQFIYQIFWKHYLRIKILIQQPCKGHLNLSGKASVLGLLSVPTRLHSWTGELATVITLLLLWLFLDFYFNLLKCAGWWASKIETLIQTLMYCQILFFFNCRHSVSVGIKWIVLFGCYTEFRRPRFEKRCAAFNTFGIKASLNSCHFLVDREEVSNFIYTLKHL